jgi:hypothetical protein
MTGKERYRPTSPLHQMHRRTHHRIGTFKPQPASRLGALICNRAMKIPVGSKQRSVWLTPPQLLLERVAKGDSEDPELDRLYEEAARYTIERFEAAQALRLLRTVNRGRTTISRLTACMDFRTRPRMVLNPVLRWSHPSPLAAHTRPFPLHADADCYLDAAMRYAAEPWLIQVQQKS